MLMNHLYFQPDYSATFARHEARQVAVDEAAYLPRLTVEIGEEHLIFCNSKGELAAPFLLEIVQSWNPILQLRCCLVGWWQCRSRNGFRGTQRTISSKRPSGARCQAPPSESRIEPRNFPEKFGFVPLRLPQARGQFRDRPYQPARYQSVAVC